MLSEAISMRFSGFHTVWVVLHFPSVEAAQAVWQSDDYQAVIKKRLDATAPKIALIVPTAD